MRTMQNAPCEVNGQRGVCAGGRFTKPQPGGQTWGWDGYGTWERGVSGEKGRIGLEGPPKTSGNSLSLLIWKHSGVGISVESWGEMLELKVGERCDEIGREVRKG